MSEPAASPTEALRLPTPTPHERRGEGVKTVEAVFRDPPSPVGEADALRREIAKILVAAPTLPVDLPAYKLRLLTVEGGKKSIALVLGMEQPIVRLRLEPETKPAPAKLVSLGAAGAAPKFALKVTIEPEIKDITRFEKSLETMSSRLRHAIPEARWTDAMAAAKKLRQLPDGVPLGFFRQLVAGMDDPPGLVRTGFNCNQDCGICWQDREWGRFGSAQVLTWIEDLRAAGAIRLIISGGEPTLDPELPRYIAHARSIGYENVNIETNAIQMSKPGVAEKLRDAGLTAAFVSLHSGNAAISDAITRAPGTHARTVKGVQRLLEVGVQVSLNAVMTQEGLDDLSGLADFIHDNFGPHPLLEGLMLSLPTDPYDRELVPQIAPDPVKLRAMLPPLIERALALGIAVRGLDGPCGPPLCAFGADPRVADLKPVPEDLDFRTHPAPCSGCAVRPFCFGVRTTQYQVYGDACVVPFQTVPLRS